MRSPFDIEIDQRRSRVVTDMTLLDNSLNQVAAYIDEGTPGIAADKMRAAIDSAVMALQSLAEWHSLLLGQSFTDVPD